MDCSDYVKLHKKLKTAASQTPGIYKAGEPVTDRVNGLGKKCWRELAFRLYDIAEQQDALDRCFPLSNVVEGEGNERKAE